MMEEYLRQALVLETSSLNFGLRWSSDDCVQVQVGGWLSVKKTNLGHTIAKKLKFRNEEDSWKHRFCSVNDRVKRFEIYKLKDKNEVELAIDFAMIKSVHLAKDSCCLMLGYARQNGDEEKVVELKALGENSLDVLERWGALLLHRSGRFDKQKFIRERQMVDKVVLFLQRRYRGAKSRRSIRAYRSRKESQEVAESMVESYIKRIHSNDDDCPSEDDDEEEKKGKSSKGEGRGEGNFDEEEEDAISIGSPTMSPPSRGRRYSQHVRFLGLEDDIDEPASDNGVLRLEQQEPCLRTDEVWENQKWVLGEGWVNCEKFLTDRIGNPLAASSLDLLGKECPPGWELTKPFELDKSGLEKNKCDSDGWIYQISFGNFDSDLAKGSEKGVPSTRWLARRRRWYRERKQTTSENTDDRMVLEGWLGLRGVQNRRRWRSRYCILVNKGSTCCEDQSSNKSYIIHQLPLAYFASFEDNDTSYSVFPMKRKREQAKLNLKALDDECFVDDSVATAANPGYFYLYLSGEKKPRLLNAGTRAQRLKWVKALKQVIARSGSPEEVMTRMTTIVEDQAAVTATPNRRLLNPTSRKRILVQHKSSLLSMGSVGDLETEAQMEKEAEAAFESTFQPPERHKNLILEGTLNASVATLKMTLLEKCEFQDQLFADDGVKNVTRSEWSTLEPKGTRKLSYLMPKKGPVPSNMAYVVEEIIKQEEHGFQVDSICKNPDVLYGKTFETHVRMVVHAVSRYRSKIIITQDINFVERTLLKAFITKGSVMEMRRYHEKQWFPFLHNYLQRNNLLETVCDVTTTEGGADVAGVHEAGSDGALEKPSIAKGETFDIFDPKNVFVVINVFLVVLVLLLFVLVYQLDTLVAENQKMLKNLLVADSLK